MFRKKLIKYWGRFLIIIESKFQHTFIGKIPVDWNIDELGNYIFEVFTGSTPHKSVRKYVENGINFIRSQNIFDFHIQEQEIANLTEKSVESISRAKLRKNDVLLNITGDGVTFLRCSIIKDHLLPAYVNQSIAVIRIKEDLDPYYLSLYLSQKRIKEYMEGFNAGSARRTLAAKHVKLFLVSIPPIIEQRALAKLFYYLNRKIELNHQMNETLEQMAQAIFKSWFVDFEPFRDPEHDWYVGEFEYNEELEKEIPSIFKLTKLKELIELFDSKRIPLSKRERDKRKGSFPYHGATSIMDYVDNYLFDGIYLLMAEDGSVMDENERPVLQYVHGKFWVNNHAHVILGSNEVSTEYVMLHLKNTNVKPFITGAVQLKINQRNLNSIPIIKPSKEIMTKFSEITNPIFEKLRQNEDQILVLQNLRDLLLPQLISGNLRIPDPEKFLEVLDT